MDRAEKSQLLEMLLKLEVFASGMAPLSAQALAAIEVEGDRFFIKKVKEASPACLQESQARPDITFTVPVLALQELTASPPENVPQMGIRIIRLLVEKDSSRRAGVSVHAGVLELMRLGYFSVLAKGGKPMVEFLTSRGLGGLSKIREILSKLKEEYVGS